MKLNIDFAELRENAKSCHEPIDLSDFKELTFYFIMCQFPNWDIEEAFNLRTLQVFEDHVEIDLNVI